MWHLASAERTPSRATEGVESDYSPYAAAPMVMTDTAPHSTGTTLPRHALLQRLSGRWDRSITVVVGGAGFGKTTLLTQAFDRDSIVGTQRWLSVSTAWSSAETFGQAIADVWDLGPLDTDDPDEIVRLLAERWWGLAPARLGLTIDDHHQLQPDAQRLLVQLAASVPANMHIVSAGRSTLPIPARMKADGRATIIDESQLLFDESELETFAALRKVPVAQVAACEGWPVLAELQATAPAGTAAEYLWQEVLESFPAERRERLALLSVVGWLDVAVGADLFGLDVEVASLVDGVPMTLRDGDRIRLHDVWQVPLLDAVAPARKQEMRRRAGEVLAAHGRTAEAFAVLAAGALWDEALALARASVINEHLTPSPAVVRQWLAALPTAMLDHPAALLLDAVARRGTGPIESIGALRVAADANDAAADPDAAVCALALLGTVAFGAQDRELGFEVIARAGRIASTGHAGAQRLVVLAGVVINVMIGNNEDALAAVSTDESGVGHLAGLSRFLHARVLFESGRTESCEALLHAHRAMMTPYRLGVALLEARVRWSDGDVTGARRGLTQEIGVALAAERVSDAAILESFDCIIAAVAGDPEPQHATLARRAEALPTLATGFTVLAHGVRLLATDPDGTKADLEACERLGGLGAIIPEARFLLPLVGFDLEVPPVQGAAGAASRLGSALAARGHDPDAAIPWADIANAAPLLPPTVLAMLAAWWTLDHAEPPGWDTLLTRPTRDEVRRIAQLDGPVAEGAAQLAEALGPEAPHPLELSVLGPVQVRIDGRAVDGELRRERVRALLLLLVVHGSITRTRAAEVLWPDLEAKAASNNLRTTLSYVVRSLEPTKPSSASSFFVRQQGALLELRNDPALRIDAHEMLTALDEASAARRIGATSDERLALDRALAWWRDRPGHDITDAGWAETEIDHWVSRFAGAAVRAAELTVTDDPERAAMFARQALAVDRWSLAAHAALVRARLVAGGPTEARVAFARYVEVADELGIGDRAPERRHLELEINAEAARMPGNETPPGSLPSR